MSEHNGFDTAALYATGALFLDVIVGAAFTGRPLHESLGLELPVYMQKLEEALLALGHAYAILKPDYDRSFGNNPPR